MFPYTVPETTKVTTILEMTAAAMRTSLRHYSFGPIPSGPSTTRKHERLDLQVLAFVNTGKNRGAGSAHLRRATEVNATLALKDVFSRPWKNLFTVPTLCIQDGRLVLHASTFPGLSIFFTQLYSHIIQLLCSLYLVDLSNQTLVSTILIPSSP